jgi:hypothetical protein
MPEATWNSIANENRSIKYYIPEKNKYNYGKISLIIQNFFATLPPRNIG